MDGCETLNDLRKKKFEYKVVKGMKSVEVQCLSPTYGAAKYHGWNISLRPEDWGWKMNCGSLLPCIMDEKPVPDALLTIIRCKC